MTAMIKVHLKRAKLLGSLREIVAKVPGSFAMMEGAIQVSHFTIRPLNNN